MPDMKEKLVELLNDCKAKGFWSYGKDCKTGEHGGHEMTAEDIADYLAENIVDAVEVVHGRWVDRYGGKYANPRYECSECKKKAPYKFEDDELHIGLWVQDLTDYCPNCGAKMDGDGDG